MADSPVIAARREKWDEVRATVVEPTLKGYLGRGASLSPSVLGVVHSYPGGASIEIMLEGAPVVALEPDRAVIRFDFSEDAARAVAKPQVMVKGSRPSMLVSQELPENIDARWVESVVDAAVARLRWF